jgi:two-component system sensor histidine kinase RegB
VAHWRATRPAQALEYRRDDLPDLPIISDTALKQMIDNVLDNALEAAPESPLRLMVTCDDDEHLSLRVLDEGPGFAATMLERLGKPYQSSKGRPGGGLGLFLSVNVARTLGGTITARNRPEGGAEVLITLPLESLTARE